MLAPLPPVTYAFTSYSSHSMSSLAVVMRDSYGGMSFWRHKKTRQDFTGNLLIPSYHVYLWSCVDVLCSDQPTGKEKVHTWNLFWMFFYQLLCKPSYKFTFLSFVRSNINKNVLASYLCFFPFWLPLYFMTLFASHQFAQENTLTTLRVS